MSYQVGRNDPCPCGSGRKYKKCCLARRKEEDRRVTAAVSAQQRRNEVFRHAVAWLQRHHGDALAAAFEEFGTAIPEDGRTLSEQDHDYFMMQAVDWVLAEATTEIDGRRVRLHDLVVEGGPVLDADQRLWFERAGEEPLRLWQVTDVDPGVGLELRNLLDESADPVRVKERSASRTLGRSDVIAARLGRWQDAWEIVSVYSIPHTEVLDLLRTLEERSAGDPADPDVARSTGKRIRDYWVWLFTRRPVPPTVVDVKGDRIELTTDHWQILDEDELARRLEAEPDVAGSRARGWSRLEDPGSEMSRVRLALNPGKSEDRLEAFARTLRLADEGRSWLERTAGPSLRFLAREIVDPMSERVLGGGEPRPGRSSGGRSVAVESLAFQTTGPEPAGDSEIPPEIKTQLMESVYRRQYQGIADQKIPVLGDKTPREALKEPGGRRRVRLWLEGFERNEKRMAEADGREPVDLGFLWQEVLGIQASGEHI
jgi:SEC-C motif